MVLTIIKAKQKKEELLKIGIIVSAIFQNAENTNKLWNDLVDMYTGEGKSSKKAIVEQIKKLDEVFKEPIKFTIPQEHLKKYESVGESIMSDLLGVPKRTKRSKKN